MISKGVIYMLLATFVFAVMNVLIKYVPSIPAIEIILFRSIVSFVMSGVALKFKKVPLLGTNRKILLIRGLAGAIALIMFFYYTARDSIGECCDLNVFGPNIYSHSRYLDC